MPRLVKMLVVEVKELIAGGRLRCCDDLCCEAESAARNGQDSTNEIINRRNMKPQALKPFGWRDRFPAYLDTFTRRKFLDSK